MWLNENAGVVILIFGIVTVVLLAIMLWLVLTLRNRFAVQRLKFVGLYATDVDSRTDYAAFTIGNRSVSEIAVKELGVKNGRVAFNLTSLYKRKEGLDEKARIVIEQRRSIGFRLERDELLALLTDGKKGKELKTLRLYAIDLTGNVYQGRVSSVKKLLAGILAAEKLAAKNGAPSVAPAPVQEPVKPAPVAPDSDPAPVAPAPVREPVKPVPAEAPAEVPLPEAMTESGLSEEPSVTETEEKFASAAEAPAAEESED